MSTGGPAFEKSRGIEDVQHLRLLVLLEEMVRDQGIMQAARELNVDHRTLNAGLETGLLSRRMRGALENKLLEGGGSPAAEQRARNDELAGRVERLEGKVDEMGEAMDRGLAAALEEVQALREEYERVVTRLAWLEAGGDGQDAGDGARDEDGDGESGDSGDGPPKQGIRLRREFPELATLEPQDDDREVFGDAWPLVREWRNIKEHHPNRGKGLDWLRVQERLLTVELALLEDHELTLPPETYPLKGLDRGAQVNWRRKALEDTRKARKRRELLVWLPRALTVRLWRR